jgi:hypothetical protein
MKKFFVLIILFSNSVFAQTDCVDLNVYTTQYLEFVTNDDSSFPVGSSFLTSSGNGWINYIKLDNADTYDSIVGNVMHFSGGVGINVAGPLCSNRTLTFSSGNLNELRVDGTVIFNQGNPQNQFIGTNYTVNWNGGETFEIIGEYQLISLFGNQNTLYDVCFVCEGLGLTQDVINYLVYPNPVTDYLYIKCSDAVTSVDVLDISGKVILSEKVIGSTSEINTSSLKVGIYHVRFMQDNGEFLYFKIIKSVL